MTLMKTVTSHSHLMLTSTIFFSTPYFENTSYFAYEVYLCAHGSIVVKTLCYKLGGHLIKT
jgi:hypothetical protein